MKRNNRPLAFSIFLFLIILALWFIPGFFHLISDNYPIEQFRSDLKDLAGLFYIVVTLWLVLVTRKMAETSVITQKALNRPEIVLELFISNENPNQLKFSSINNVEIRSTVDAKYIPEQEGASVFLLIKNRYGGGKAININIISKFSAHNPDNFTIEREFKIDFLAEGDAIAFYIFRYDKPSTDRCKLEINRCEIEYSTPFTEASNEPKMKTSYTNDNNMLATGNHIGLITLGDGIRIDYSSQVN